MSRTEIFAVEPDGDVVGAYELRNGMAGAMLIWCMMCDRHLAPEDEAQVELYERTGRQMRTGYQELFDLLKTDRLTRWEKIVLLTTCDGAVVKAEDFVQVAEAMDIFYKEYKLEPTASHLHKQAEVLRILEAEREEKEWRGVCWNQTSVNADSPWYGIPIYETNDDGEEEEVDTRSYNIDQDEKHWFLCQESVLDNCAAESV